MPAQSDDFLLRTQADMWALRVMLVRFLARSHLEDPVGLDAFLREMGERDDPPGELSESARAGLQRSREALIRLANELAGEIGLQQELRRRALAA